MSQAGMSSVCRTLSLATLQNVFPGAKHWRQRTPNRTLPTEQSPYVIEFIGTDSAVDIRYGISNTDILVSIVIVLRYVAL